jgi:hypothetical protein
MAFDYNAVNNRVSRTVLEGDRLGELLAGLDFPLVIRPEKAVPKGAPSPFSGPATPGPGKLKTRSPG